MRHRLGISEYKFMGIIFHIPEPYRHYFQFRDSLNLLFLNHVPLYSKLRLTLILIPKIFIYPLILDRKSERFCWMIKGIIDFALRVKGLGSAFSKLSS